MSLPGQSLVGVLLLYTDAVGVFNRSGTGTSPSDSLMSYLEHSLLGRRLNSLQRCNRRILQPQHSRFAIIWFNVKSRTPISAGSLTPLQTSSRYILQLQATELLTFLCCCFFLDFLYYRLQMIFNRSIWSKYGTLIRRVDLTVMAMMVYSTLPRSQEMKSHDPMQFILIPSTPCF